jgi:hypothetical protein
VSQLEGPLKEEIAGQLDEPASDGLEGIEADERPEVEYASDDPIATKMVNCAIGVLDDLLGQDLADALEETVIRFVRDDLDGISLEDAERAANSALQPLAALDVLPVEFPVASREIFIEFARIAVPAYEASLRIADAIRAGTLASHRVPIFVGWLGPCFSPVVGDQRRGVYGDYYRDTESAAADSGHEDPTATEALAYVNAWFSRERMEAAVDRLRRPYGIEALCRRYGSLRDWDKNPQGAVSTWLFIKQRLGRGDCPPARGDWFEWI